MKKLFVTVLLMMCVVLVDAQIPGGTMMIGGSVDFSSDTDKIHENGQTHTLGTTTSFNLNPQFGYFVVDNLVLGAGIGLYSSVSKMKEFDSKRESTGIAFTPFMRYYMNNLFFHGEGGFGTGKSKYEGVYGQSENEATSISWGLGAGYAVFLNNNVAIEPMFGYQSRSSEYSNEDEKDIVSGLYLRVGIQVYLRR